MEPGRHAPDAVAFGHGLIVRPRPASPARAGRRRRVRLCPPRGPAGGPDGDRVPAGRLPAGAAPCGGSVRRFWGRRGPAVRLSSALAVRGVLGTVAGAGCVAAHPCAPPGPAARPASGRVSAYQPGLFGRTPSGPGVERSYRAAPSRPCSPRVLPAVRRRGPDAGRVPAGRLGQGRGPAGGLRGFRAVPGVEGPGRAAPHRLCGPGAAAAGRSVRGPGLEPDLPGRLPRRPGTCMPAAGGRRSAAPRGPAVRSRCGAGRLRKGPRPLGPAGPRPLGQGPGHGGGVTSR